jgi:hypothetical protein
MWLARQRQLARVPERCEVCGSDFVHPIEWGEASDTQMWVRLRCGECETWREDVFGDDELERYERKLDDDAEQIGEAAQRLHAEWRAAEADAFAVALERDLIDAGDFGG